MDACFPDSVVGISSDHNSNDYIYYFLTTLQRHLDSKATMAAQKNINLRVLSEIKLPLPGINEQNRIVIQLDALAERTRALGAATQENLTISPPSKHRCSMPPLKDNFNRISHG